MRKDSDGKVISSLTSNYLCLQCPAIEKEETMAKHGTKKSHRFCRLSLVLPHWFLLLRADTRAKVIDSRSGSLFCQMCDDFVWDPTLEDLRNRKIDTGTFSSKTKFPFYLSL